MATDDGNEGERSGTTGVRVTGHVGIAVWTLIGVVLAIGIAVLVLSVIAEVVIPVALAALLAVVLKPAGDRLVRRKLRPAIAAGIVVLGLGALLGGIAAATISGVSSQSDKIHSAIDDAVQTLADETGIDAGTIQEARTAINESSALVALGSVTKLVSGVNSLIGLASGVLLGALVFYYLVKDGTLLRQRFVQAVNPVHRVELTAAASVRPERIRVEVVRPTASFEAGWRPATGFGGGFGPSVRAG